MRTYKTNIKKRHKEFLKPLLGRHSNVVLVSCFVDGQPSVAISEIERDGEDYLIRPLFVEVTDGMKITDHDGVEASLSA